MLIGVKLRGPIVLRPPDRQPERRDPARVLLSDLVRFVCLASLLSLTGCFHNWVLEHQCHKIRVGMPWTEAYRLVSREPVCKFDTGRGWNEDVPACLEHRADVPWAVVWNSPVVGAESPDQCGISVDATGHVAHVHYMSGD